MREVTSLPIGEEPVIGEVYSVWCVDLRKIALPDPVNASMAAFRKNQHHLVALPVIGNIHSDPEFPGTGGELPHLHLDIRFMTYWEFKTLWLTEPETAFGPGKIQLPILPANNGLKLPEPYLHPKMCNYRTGDYRTIEVGGTFSYRMFEDEMEKKTLKLENPLCPHHGTSLAGQPVRDGVITCPTHSLNWCPLTGRLKRKTCH